MRYGVLSIKNVYCIKKILGALYCLTSLVVFSQEKSIQKIESTAKEIEITTQDLDHIILENTTSRFTEVFLFDENTEKHRIQFSEKGEVLKIDFQTHFIGNEKPIFRKFITKRLQRAYALVKVPKNKSVKIFGSHIDIESKSYIGNLAVFIEKGNLKLHQVKGGFSAKLYSGNVFARLQNKNIHLISNLGNILVDSIERKKNYQKKNSKNFQKFKVETIKGNIFLITK